MSPFIYFKKCAPNINLKFYFHIHLKILTLGFQEFILFPLHSQAPSCFEKSPLNFNLQGKLLPFFSNDMTNIQDSTYSNK
jgi:hypothetical protein